MPAVRGQLEHSAPVRPVASPTLRSRVENAWQSADREGARIPIVPDPPLRRAYLQAVPPVAPMAASPIPKASLVRAHKLAMSDSIWTRNRPADRRPSSEPRCRSTIRFRTTDRPPPRRYGVVATHRLTSRLRQLRTRLRGSRGLDRCAIPTRYSAKSCGVACRIN